ncbi:MAG: DUF4307 domain-containing protein [Actinobacteria bacterium]|jgi:Domain of unknown function (DUF4307)|nr:DUF4307 domain-containing protein [Actinomycetota bacterium]NDC52344.1 DUF4307 domain-containing protein [Actinomycetota bacterium]NDD60293.1 DUF4307 domain-containing protein [Actinomycetota bacterium]
MPERFANLDPETQEFLRQRYGIKESSRWRLVAVGILIIGIPWLIWTALYHSNPEIRFSLVSFTSIDEKSISITFDITRKDPATPLRCTLVARDFDKNVVGESEELIPPAKEKLVRHTATIPTRLKAVNADVLRCAP